MAPLTLSVRPYSIYVDSLCGEQCGARVSSRGNGHGEGNEYGEGDGNGNGNGNGK